MNPRRKPLTQRLRPSIMARRPLVWLAFGTFLMPTILYLVMAWQDRLTIEREAEQLITNTTGIFGQHARNVFETHKLVAEMVNEHIRGLGWDEIAASEEVHRYLARVVRDHTQIHSLWLIDPSGIVRNSSAPFPTPPVSVTDRDYFVALRAADAGVFVGQVVHGRVFNDDIFNVAERRMSRSGEFDGVVDVSALPTYFSDFWQSHIEHDGITTTLVHQNGSILARQPGLASDIASLPADTHLMRAIATSESGFFRDVSPFDGQERLYAFQKVVGFPAYVSHGVTVTAALQPWREHLVVYGWFFGVGALGLSVLTFLSLRQAKTEAVALQRWRDTAEELHQAIEQRNLAEEQLRQAQKMEILGQLAGTMTHDFGNVLAIISGYLERVRREAAPAHVKLIDRALEATDLGNGAIRSMLGFARRQPLEPQEFDINEPVDRMRDFLQRVLRSRITLDIQLAESHCTVLADRNQMELAILNLAINARDAMPHGGTVTISLRPVQLNGEPKGLVGHYVAVSVRDTGRGMSPDVAARAFEPFFTTKGAGLGTGLGLSMVHRFTQESDGTTTIDSKLGEGTTVTIYLPLRKHL